MPFPPDSAPVRQDLVFNQLASLEENIDNVLKASIPNKQSHYGASVIASRFFADIRTIIADSVRENCTKPSEGTVTMLQEFLALPTVQEELAAQGKAINWVAFNSWIADASE